MVASRDGLTVEIDLAVDSPPLHPFEFVDGLPVLAPLDLAARKILADDAIAAGRLDWSHRDPFDRMIVAQAMRQDLVLVTRDPPIRSFLGVRTIAA
ncbi:MAG: hypothetical protein ACKV2O_17905 [Acidimicrobiales bacterium]